MLPADTTSPNATPASPRALFLTFTALALQGFGGVLAVAQRELVERKRWLSRDEFLEAYSASQLLPGPNVVNMALILGDRFFGWRGALAAMAGMLAVPLAIVLLLAASYGQFSHHPMVAGALRGMGAVAAGLTVAMALKLLGSLRNNPMGPTVCAVLVLATLMAIAALRLPLAGVVLGLGALGWSAARWRLRKAAARQ
ncbi:chromate transporter [Rhodocyclaceae bacterium]|jgi:chromate transporter|nr:chromate transporter [Rhodocyclaceae bacterium]